MSEFGNVIRILVCAVLLAGAQYVSAQETSVAVLYNRSMRESRLLAEYYAEQRNIPDSHVIGLRLPEEEVISRKDFQERLQEKLLEELEDEGLFEAEIPDYSLTMIPGTEPELKVRSSIRYLVLTYGVPLKISGDPTVSEIKEKSYLQENLQGNMASVDSELAALPLRTVTSQLSGPLANRMFNTTNYPALNPTNGVLMVTRIDGPSLGIARGLIDKSIAAEKTGLWGRAYFDARGLPQDSGYFKGDQAIITAAQIAQARAFDVILDNGPATFSAAYPMSHIALYAGWYDGQVSGPFALPEVEFMPGAVAYHLHSFSANTIKDATKNWVAPLLQKGATATLGCVFEPYLEFTPNMAVFFNALLAGATFGEAAYVSQNVLSWQNIAVGDPLYRPFGKPLSEFETAMTDAEDSNADWINARFINALLLRGANPKEIDDFYTQNEARVKILETSPVLQEQLALVKAKLGEKEAAISHYEKALGLATSRQQKKRLYLALAEGYTLTDNPELALEKYEQFLGDFSDYPEKEKIYSYMLPLAEKLGDESITESIKSRTEPMP